MTYKSKRFFLIGSLLAIFTLFSSINLRAAEETEKFEPGSFIIGHIIDNYGWHLAGDASIPLPIILFDGGKPVVFMSSQFHHGHCAYNGYAIGFTPESKGKIVKLAGENANYTGEIAELAAENGVADEAGMEALIDKDAFLLDISITKNVCGLLVAIIICATVFLSVAKQYKKREGKAPHGLQGVVEPLILFIRDEVAIPSLGKDHYQKYFPYLLTLFFFILINNLMGLIPIFPFGANVTGNIAVTGILAIITFFITQFSSNKTYWKHIVNTPGVPWWLKFPLPIMPVVELIGLFTKPFVLMIRLFANITAGHIIVLGFIGLIFIFGAMAPALGFALAPVSLVFYLFMGLLELLVAFVQAFVFTLLTALYIGMAMEEEHEEEHEPAVVETTKEIA
ncbi:MAG: F0F1 ATP synthase subunit A [Bacteroidales bacterium]|nr:F0F1 ATP synthase subunit A [Bacteroidales bacterium]